MDISERIKLAEKRTFVFEMKCSCGGEYRYDSSEAFTSLFKAVTTKEHAVYKHVCAKCGDVKQFENMYPLEQSFTIGLSSKSKDIRKVVAEHFQTLVHNDLNTLQKG